MLVSGPPPSRPSPGNDPRLDAARGAVREALSAIRNLEQLLKSVRVGPKALMGVIPDVHQSSSTLIHRVEELLGAVEQRLDDPICARELKAFVQPRVDELTAALQKAKKRAITAKTRLALEALVERVAGELDAARSLLDMLDGAAWGRGVHVNLLEVVRESFKQSEALREGTQQLRVGLTSNAPDLELLINPRVAAMLFGLCAALVCRGTEQGASIRISRAEDQGCLVRVSAGIAEGAETVLLSSTPAIAPASSCAQAAAVLTGASVQSWKLTPEGEAGSEVVLLWPASACSPSR